MKIQYQRGYTIDKSVDVVVNSANGFLLLGTSGASRIREASEPLHFLSLLKYKFYLSKLPKLVRGWFVDSYKEHNWKITRAQLSCVRLLLQNKGKPYKRGSAVLDKNKVGNKRIIHAVGMSYSVSKSVKRIPATVKTIKSTVDETLKLAVALQVTSIAIPLMCSRKSYGISPKKSLEAIKSVLKKYRKSSIRNVIICFDNEESQTYLKKL